MSYCWFRPAATLVLASAILAVLSPASQPAAQAATLCVSPGGSANLNKGCS